MGLKHGSISGAPDRAQFYLLQLVDSSFPLGAFAHSAGLEYAIRGGIVGDLGSLREWGLTGLRHSLMRMEGAALWSAYELAASVGRGESADEKRFRGLYRLHERLAAARPALEQRRASAQMGRSLLRTVQEINEYPVLLDFAALTLGKNDESLIEFAPTWGAVSAWLDIPAPESLGAFLLGAVRQWAHAAVRLIPLGQMDAQRFIREMSDAIQICMESPPPDWPRLRSATPGLDLAALGQAGMAARYFRS